MVHVVRTTLGDSIYHASYVQINWCELIMHCIRNLNRNLPVELGQTRQTDYCIQHCPTFLLCKWPMLGKLTYKTLSYMDNFYETGKAQTMQFQLPQSRALFSDMDKLDAH